MQQTSLVHVIDDDDAVRQSLAFLLGTARIAVRTYESATAFLAALTDALKHKGNPAHSAALDELLAFIETYQADPKDGVWLDTLTAEGKPKVSAKAHSWKANYHDVRALMKFIEGFGPGFQPR